MQLYAGMQIMTARYLLTTLLCGAPLQQETPENEELPNLLYKISLKEYK